MFDLLIWLAPILYLSVNVIYINMQQGVCEPTWQFPGESILYLAINVMRHDKNTIFYLKRST